MKKYLFEVGQQLADQFYNQKKMSRNDFHEFIMNLETQTLTDELKLEILDKHFDAIQIESLTAEKKGLQDAMKLVEEAFKMK
jgi:hypothetical protein